MATGRRQWWPQALVLGLVVAAGLALSYLRSPPQVPPLPDGWTAWPAPGATLAVAVTPDAVYAGGSLGLFRLGEDGAATAVSLPATGGGLVVSAILLDRRGALWVGHNHGLSVRTGSGWRTVGAADGLPHRHVLALAESRGGAVWIGTERGAARAPAGGLGARGALEPLTRRDGLLHDTVAAIAEDPEGGLWFGTQAAPEGGLSRLKDGRWQHWTVKDGLPHADVTSLLVTADGRVWAGCGRLDLGGAAVFSSAAGTWRLAETIPGSDLAGPKVRSLFEDRLRRIWIGSEQNGLTVRRPDGTLHVVRPADGLPVVEVMSVAEAGNGGIWFGTPVGAMRVSRGALASLAGTSGEAEQRTAP